jgi:hypothetical protein
MNATDGSNFNARTAVYSGRDIVGAFARNGRGYVAESGGRRLGEYASRDEAIAAIMQTKKAATVH